MKIHAPDKTFTGESRYGDLILQFEDGVAEHDGDLPAPVRSYMASTGYGIDEPAREPEQPAGPPQQPAETRVGTPLADASTQTPAPDGDQDDDEDEDGDAFDPADFTVDEVNAHLADADLDERERVLQAEAEGKGRTTVLTGPYSDLSGKD